jgi:hypothetical protein
MGDNQFAGDIAGGYNGVVTQRVDTETHELRFNPFGGSRRIGEKNDGAAIPAMVPERFNARGKRPLSVMDDAPHIAKPHGIPD